jgi:hypothetical protein
MVPSFLLEGDCERRVKWGLMDLSLLIHAMFTIVIRVESLFNDKGVNITQRQVEPQLGAEWVLLSLHVRWILKIRSKGELEHLNVTD